MSQAFHFLSLQAKRDQVEEPHDTTTRNRMGYVNFARHAPDASATNRNHFAIGLVVVSKIVFPRLSVDHVEEKLLELFIARTCSQRCHNVELQITAKTWAELSITRKPQLVAVLAEMQVRHRTDETDALRPSGNLVVSSRTICSKFRLRN